MTFLSICGYSDPVTMQELETHRIDELEALVKHEFAELIENKENLLESVDRMNIFGFYGSSVSRFRFLPGHRIMMEKYYYEYYTAKQHDANQFIQFGNWSHN